MAAKLCGGTAIEGVVAYQDADDETLFHYIPTDVQTILGETLQQFSVTYWGIGRAYLIRQGNYFISVVGASMDGRAMMDISSYQRGRIIEAIRAAYHVENPTLLPMHIDNVEVQPVIGRNTLEFGPDSTVKFPRRIHFAVPFNFSISTGNSLFAQFVGAQAAGDFMTANPAFGVLIYGEALFQGQPWEVRVATDLSRVWSYARQQFAAGIHWSWIEIPLATFQTIIEDMVSKGIIKLDFSFGSMDASTYGRAILEMGKKVFEAVNALGLSKEGFFYFETKKRPPPSTQPDSGFSWPWAVYINAAYTDRSIASSPDTLYQQDISYTGIHTVVVTASMTLAVACNSATAEHYRDLGDPAVPCITAEKAQLMQQRIQQEREAKKEQADRIYERWVMGEITDKQYYEEMDALYRISAKESKKVVEPASGPSMGPELGEGSLILVAPRATPESEEK